MLVTLIKKSHISTLSLPEKVHGQYWIQDYKNGSVLQLLMSVEAHNGKWELKGNRNARIITDGGKSARTVVLEPNSFYDLDVAGTTDRSVLFAEPATEDRQIFRKYWVKKNCTLQIGRATDNDVVFKSSFVSAHHARLNYTDGVWVVTDMKSTNGTFVNEKAAIAGITVSAGDVIYIMGLKIILGNGFVAINNPDGKVEITTKQLDSMERQLVEPKTDEDEENIPPETKYFYRSPRFKRDIETASFRVDPPPSDQIGDEMPFALAVGPSITMGMASVVTGGFTVANAVASGNMTSAIPAAVMSASMLLGTMLWPVISKQYEKKRKQKREALRQKKYAAYLDKVRESIAAESLKQREILKENSVMPQTCVNRIANIERNLWERGANQDDFLQFRLGLGTVPLQAEITYTERKFTLDDDNLQEEMYQLCESPKLLENVPISISLKEHPITGVIGARPTVTAFIKGLILQLTALYGYDEVKCVFLYDENEEREFSFVKWLPHIWDGDKRIRFIATNNAELKEVSAFIGREIEKRQELTEREAAEATPHFVVFALSKDVAMRADMLKQIYASKSQLNMSVVACFDELKNLPKECSTVVELQGDSGKLYNRDDVSGRAVPFLLDTLVFQDMLPIAKQLANISLDMSSGTYKLPQLITFLEMFGVGKVEHLNSLNRWKENDPTKSLEAAVGVSTLGDIFMLDLHEKFHGPHGLVAGMTGSGKSEFIITYILSLAVNYHPNEVAFVLIDYKGGGMAKSFKNLPHTAGIITNLDGQAIKRSLLSIESELTRRQAIFNAASEKLGVSNIDIYKYQKLYREGAVSEPLQHLFIISDEFAELKTQKPEFMEQLVSAARIGRSLGVHLILATQKPSGVVDDQIWSNSKFRVCLKVQDRSDSMDMLKRPEAAELSDTGRFYLQVGYNELFELGQSAWAGAPYYPTDNAVADQEESIAVIDRNGRVLKKVKLDKYAGTVKNPKKQLDAITNYLHKIAEEDHIQIRKLWLDPIPDLIYIEDLRKKYDTSVESSFELTPLIGELDDPRNQRQCAMRLPLSREGNVVIFGSTGSGKTSFLNAMVYSLITEHSPEEVNLYLLDFGSETLSAFSKAPHVGDVVLGFEKEKINNLFKMLLKEVGRRKKLFSGFGGDYNTYISSGTESLPNVIVAINNYSAFKEMYDDQEDVVSFLSREGAKYGVYFVITANGTNAVGFRLLQNFKQQITLQLNDETEYSIIVGQTDGLIPARFKGRGLIKLDNIYEFQVAHLTENMATFEYIQRCCEVLQFDWRGKPAKRIPILPEKVDVDFVASYYDGDAPLMIPVGVSTSSMDIQYFPFAKRCVSMVASSDEGYTDFLSAFVELLESKNVDVTVFDVERTIKKSQGHRVMCVNEPEACNNMVHQLVEETVNRNNTYKDALATGQEIQQYPLKVVVINSLATLMDVLSEDEKTNLKAALTHNALAYNLYFIIGEKAKKLMRHTFEQWYSKQISTRDFIWIGDGITNQVQLNVEQITAELRDEVLPGFGFCVQNGKAVKIKVLSCECEEES